VDECIEVNCQHCGRVAEMVLPLPDDPVLCYECESYAEAEGRSLPGEVTFAGGWNT